jgi:phosphatidylglycerol:prolipoprotein diacylglycerol transferase
MALAFPFSIVGAKVVYLFQMGRPFEILAFLTPGYSVFGAGTFVLIVWLIWSLVRPFQLTLFLDCASPGAYLGLACFRLTCFLRGCCGGITCDLPWAVQFSTDTFVYSSQLQSGQLLETAKRSLPVHPVQLYEALFALISAVLLLMLFKNREAIGQVFFTGILSYGIFRFGMEFIRIQTSQWRLFDSLTLAQVFSLILVAAGMVGLGTLRHHLGKTTENQTTHPDPNAALKY